MVRKFNFYKKDGTRVLTEVASPATLTGLSARTSYAKGDFTVTSVEDNSESASVEVPAFKTSPPAPTGVVNNSSTATELKINWTAVPNAKAYVIHYIDKSTTNPSELTLMGYSETPNWSLTSAAHGSAITGKKFTVTVQTYDELGVGSTPVEKAAYLHDGNFLGSPWSNLVTITLP